jgi:hypothetical protein
MKRKKEQTQAGGFFTQTQLLEINRGYLGGPMHQHLCEIKKLEMEAKARRKRERQEQALATLRWLNVPPTT